MEIGIRELRAHLGGYLKDVVNGAEIVITDHGRAVARLVPLARPWTLDRLIDDGVVTRSAVPHGPLRRAPIRARGIVSDLIDDQRP